jgi:Sulfatase
MSFLTLLSVVLAVVLSVKGQDVNTQEPFDGIDTSAPVENSPPTPAPTPAHYDKYTGDYDNVLMIVLDQLRYDTLGFVQSSMDRYSDYTKIRTPNIDSLAAQGVAFRTAHSQSNSCAPSRGTIKTGYTVARHGVTTNPIIDEKVYSLMESVKSKIDRIRTFEEILRFNLGYTVETYGKWHFPENQYGAIQHNYYDYQTNEFSLWPQQTFKPLYQSALDALPSTPNCVFQSGDQLNTISGCGYSPLPNDPRYGTPTQTSESALPNFMRGKELGEDSYDVNHTSTAILGDMGLRALDRIMNDPNSGPFLLSIHFNAPVSPEILHSILAAPHEKC